ncbi:MAG TPA: hypothetical protein VIM93_11790 [Kangiella sp.]|uniref:hypothetical protein n=1 Tax=Kangiella sp. TaxID=1920245 RepID=UPI002F94243B
MNEEELKAEAKKLYERIKTQRDELKVQAYLAKAELRDKWQETEHDWERFEAKAKTIGKGAQKASEDIGKGFTLMGNQLQEAYKDLKQAFKSSDLTG